MRLVLSLALVAGITNVTFPQGAPRTVIEQSAAAMGGLDRLRGLAGVRLTETGGEYLVSTLTRGDAPARLIAQSVTTLRSGRDSLLRRTMVQTFPMRAGSFAGSTIANRGAVAVTRGTALAPASVFDAVTAREELALSPERALLTALDASDLRLGSDTSLAGVRHRVVGFTFEGAPVRLFIDASSHLTTRVELTRSYPTNVFWAMWGDMRFTTVWSAWSLESSGIWYPRQRTVALNGAPFREYVVTSLDVDVAVPSDSVAMPDSVRAAALALLSRAVGSGSAPALKSVMLSDNVVLYEGGYQAAAVRQSDGVVIIEAPESNAKSRAVLADIATRWPGVRVKAVVSTSPMWMHIAGVREYVARRIPVYVVDANVDVVRALVAAPHRQHPDSLQRSPAAPIIRSVASLTALGRGAERIELRPARGQHSSSMLLVWMPVARLLYASDVVVPDAFEPVFASAYRAELERIVRRERLDVERMFALHLAATRWAPAER